MVNILHLLFNVSTCTRLDTPEWLAVPCCRLYILRTICIICIQLCKRFHLTVAGHKYLMISSCWFSGQEASTSTTVYNSIHIVIGSTHSNDMFSLPVCQECTLCLTEVKFFCYCSSWVKLCLYYFSEKIYNVINNIHPLFLDNNLKRDKMCFSTSYI